MSREPPTDDPSNGNGTDTPTLTAPSGDESDVSRADPRHAPALPESHARLQRAREEHEAGRTVDALGELAALIREVGR